MLKLDLPQLVGRSDAIFIGKVVATQSFWSSDQRHIFTETTLTVDELIQGWLPERHVIIQTEGGRVDGMSMRVTGSPALQLGDHVLLFTDQRRGYRRVSGMMQGLYYVEKDITSGLRVVQRSTSPGVSWARKTASGWTPMRDSGGEKQPLEQFIREIREAAQLCQKDGRTCQSP